METDHIQNKNTSSPSMFSKLPQHQHHHQQQHHHQHHHHPFSHHFQLSRHDSQTSEEETNSHNSAATNTTPITAGVKSRQVQEPTSGAGGGDGATIEVVRRPRGRPPGSKNKPKPPVFITREPEPAMSPYILEVLDGNDVVETISNFCRQKSMGICVLTGSGTVANVTLRQPSATPGSTITFHGRFDILSISATFLLQNAASPAVSNIFAISLAGPQGQIVGGSVMGPLLAAGTVFIIAATFNNPSYHRLPVLDEQRASASASAGGGEGQSPVRSSECGVGGAESGHVGGGESCGMSMYSCHLPSGGGGGDVIWAPTARPPQPPPPY